MQRFSRKWLRGWAGMALFAMLAVLTSPALAWNCCCASESAPALPIAAPVESPIETPVEAPNASHPDCHGHDDTTGIEAKPALENRVSGQVAGFVAVAAPVPASAPQACWKSLCECSHAPESAAFFVESPQNSFALLVMGQPGRVFSPIAIAPASSVRFAFASNAARPRGPELESRSGRAPPAFGP